MSPPAAAQAAPSARARQAGRRSYAAPRPRRVSGPARRPAATRPARAIKRGGLLLWLLSALERLASHRLVDRLIRGRAWLMVLTFALIGIVTLQLALLKLNGAMGRALHSQAVLQRENASLSIENSELSAPDRVQARAAQLGLVFASSSSLRFLAPTFHGDFARGAAALASPLHVPASGSEQSSSARASGSAAEGAGSEAHAAEAGGAEGRAASEAHGTEGAANETRASEGASTGARSSESASAQAAPGGGETSSPAASEAGARAQAPAGASEGSGAGESPPSGGARAGSGG
jgi:hypothetical protein